MGNCIRKRIRRTIYKYTLKKVDGDEEKADYAGSASFCFTKLVKTIVF